ncbi:glycoside hydrolase family 73 protein [Pseudogulbenkiania subflava]|uniref:Flagellar protein FlgJ n=1 Tax=Pseudogulbenkiania subflava DSM 22618 TaxID=1123014 RepID=A0A1Y6BGN2_9NEIS|nr:glucosaminidase domain-containing protein [Pseudogulbenkiania subflava]SMF06859.1 flagellar protein FlgJ [Pseudogulbenkiania subflava DSM 22618]
MFRSDSTLGSPAFDAAWRAVALPLPTAGEGGGFSALYRQTRQEVVDSIEKGFGASEMTLSPEGAWARQRGAEALAATVGGDDASTQGTAQQAFLSQVEPYAREAGARLGVAPDLIAAHAALESGWGKRPLTQADGSNSHNLFGIKAGAGWQGEVAAALTTEHEAGADVKRSERFRVYPDMRGAFADYTQLLAGNPRFRSVLGVGNDATAFAQALAKGGYATDPDYAGKLTRVVASIRAGS